MAAIAGYDWLGVELTSEVRVEEIVMHLCRWARRNLKVKNSLNFRQNSLKPKPHLSALDQ